MNILVADDNSPDGTGDEVRKLMQKWKNIDISSGEKYGLGAAYIRAMTYAVDKLGADVMFELDADLQHDPEKIPEFLEKIDEGYDMVIGNRYSDGGSIPKNWPLLRKLFSIAANLFVRTVFMKFSVHDWTGGFRALKKEVFLRERKELTNYKGYIFQISFLHKAIRDGFKISEVPFHFSDRTLGKSKIAPIGYILEVFKFVISTRIRELLLGKFGKFLVVGGVGFIINWVVFNILLSVSNMRPEIANLAGAALAIFLIIILTICGLLVKEKQIALQDIFKNASVLRNIILRGYLYSDRHYFYFRGIFGRENRLLINLYFIIGTGFLLIWNFTVYNKIIWRNKPQR